MSAESPGTALRSSKGVPATKEVARAPTITLRAKLLVALFSFALCFAVIEASLRFFVGRLSSDTQLDASRAIEALPGSPRIYGLRPSLGAPYETNSHGFRGAEVTPAKSPGTLRVVMLGDSITYGNSVRADQTFSYLLEQRLNAGGSQRPYEVLNLGVSGYNTGQELATLREVGLRFAPDLVVLNICLNDSDPARELLGGHLRVRSAVTRLSDINLRTIIGSSYVLTFFKENLVRFLGDRARVLTHLNSPAVFLDSRVKESAWASMKSEMQAIADLANERQIPLLAIIYPYRSQIWLEEEKRVPQRDLAGFLAGLAVPVLDAAPAYRELGDAMFVDGYIHLSPQGHETIAGVIHEFMLRETSLLAEHAGAGTETPADGIISPVSGQ